jgi:hypothetical protein
MPAPSRKQSRHFGAYGLDRYLSRDHDACHDMLGGDLTGSVDNEGGDPRVIGELIDACPGILEAIG